MWLLLKPNVMIPRLPYDPKRSNVGLRMEMEDFGLMELEEVPIIGNRFTWHNVEDNVLSRLHGFLVYENLINMWKVLGQEMGL